MVELSLINGKVDVTVNEDALKEYLSNNSAISFDNYLRDISKTVHRIKNEISPPSDEIIYFI